jgi:hypothetical protein
MGSEQVGDGARAALGAIADQMRAWRKAHPKATYYDIEVAVEEHLAQARACLVAEVAADGEAIESSEAVGAEHPRCPTCGQPLVLRGEHTREVTGRGGERTRLRRSYGFCPACRAGLFPPG